mgnify:CR=1 FL=1
MKVLIIEDERDIVETISLAFQIGLPGVKVVSTHLGEKGIEMAESEAPDVIILDLGLPDISGFEVLKQIRLFSTIPILILTVRSEEADIVKGLEWGADDYVAKPFKQMELLTRVKALARRQRPPGEEPPLVCGPLRLDPSTRQLFHGGKQIDLTGTETRILHNLMRNAGHVVTHSSLAEAVWGEWGENYADAANSLKVHIRRLREKLEVDPSHPRLILTKAGVGYLLAKPGQP